MSILTLFNRCSVHPEQNIYMFQRILCLYAYPLVLNGYFTRSLYTRTVYLLQLSSLPRGALLLCLLLKVVSTYVDHALRGALYSRTSILQGHSGARTRDVTGGRRRGLLPPGRLRGAVRGRSASIDGERAWSLLQLQHAVC